MRIPFNFYSMFSLIFDRANNTKRDGDFAYNPAEAFGFLCQGTVEAR